MNAIQRLHDAIAEWAGDDETDPAFHDEWDALAAVDALHQAAKTIAQHEIWRNHFRSCECPYCQHHHALAAAVRRIEGDQ